MAKNPERNSGYAMVAPAVLALGAVALYPLLAAGWMSLHRIILVFHERQWLGLDNFASLMGDGRFWSAFGNTAYFALVAVTLEVVLGLGFAMLLNAAFPGRGALRAAVLVPWAVPTVVSAKMWAWFFNPDQGLLAAVLPLKDVNWLGSPGYAMHAAIVVDVWKTTPFVALLLLAGLQSIPEELYQAGRVDGATRWQLFRNVTLPLMRPALLLAVLFRSLDALRVFDAIYVLTEGGPANTTETLSIYAYKTLMRSGDFGYGATLAVATFLIILLFSLGYLRLFRRHMTEVDS
ncbi:MAG TPA: sugar ABC transporter permease [Myxococcaceae bacterium]|nr:sugar ABC transporter permease [Myxococcaceae bacterium]